MLENKTQTPLKYPNTPEQTDWLIKTKNGQRQAFNNIVQKYQQSIYNFCYRMLGNAYEAEDAAQEIFLRAYTRLDSYNSEYNFSTWLFSIASHYCIDQLRKRRRICWISWDSMEFWHIAPNEKSFQPEETLIEAETTREVHALLNSLSPDQRAAIILKYWYKMSYQEIAQTLNSTVSTVRNRLFRARKMMAKAGSRNYGETRSNELKAVMLGVATR
jgi:RNA polymerase sigma-70 factor (ECF subfamily)